MNEKELILETAREMGFSRTVIASLEPLEADAERYAQWLENGYAGGMNYLKREPHFRTTPTILAPYGRSVISVAVNYYSQVPEPPGPFWGKVARYAVGLDYHVIIRRKLRELKSELEKKLGRPLIGKAYTDDVMLFEQALASRHGLGFIGKNSLIIGPKLSGSFYFIAELFTDIPLEADEPYAGTCGACFRCGDACPTNAIIEGAQVNSNLCISYLTIENKDGIPEPLRKGVGEWVFGCDICQDVCPYNQRPPESVWTELKPVSGVGHHLDLLNLLSLNDTDFTNRFITSAVRRPKLRGLARNALVVLGNQMRETADSIPSTIMKDAVDAVFSFADRQQDPMLREHAKWCLEQCDTSHARTLASALL